MSKILFLDLELSPNEGYSWGQKWQTNIIKYTRESELLSIAWKWYGKKKLYGKARKNYMRGTDKALAVMLWEVMDKADVIVGHNMAKFDRRFANRYFALHGMPPPSPYQVIDTLKECRKHFNLPSYKLADIVVYFSLGKKMDTGGFDLWDVCMQSNIPALAKMLKYNKQDVFILEPLYKFILPWITTHPSVNLMVGRPDSCPRCLSVSFKSMGIRTTKTQQYKRYRCLDCKGCFTDNKAINKKQKVNVAI